MRIKFVKSVEEIKPLDEEVIIIDHIHFLPKIKGDHALLLRNPVIKAIIKRSYEKFGDIYSVWLYHMGF